MSEEVILPKPLEDPTEAGVVGNISVDSNLVQIQAEARIIGGIW